MKKVLQNSKKVTTKITADKKTAHFAYVASTTSSTGLQTFTPRLQKAKAAASNSHRHPLSNQPSLSTTPATAPAALAALSATQANSSASSGSAGSGSAAEQSLALQLRAARIPFVREYRFAAMATGGTGKGLRERLAKTGLKDWRFDFALPAYNLAIEIEGGSWTNGRHTRGKGFSEDLIKYDAAMRLGFNVYRCDSRMVQSGQSLQTVQGIIERSERPKLEKPPLHELD